MVISKENSSKKTLDTFGYEIVGISGSESAKITAATNDMSQKMVYFEFISISLVISLAIYKRCEYWISCELLRFPCCDWGATSVCDSENISTLKHDQCAFEEIIEHTKKARSTISKDGS